MNLQFSFPSHTVICQRATATHNATSRTERARSGRRFRVRCLMEMAAHCFTLLPDGPFHGEASVASIGSGSHHHR